MKTAKWVIIVVMVCMPNPCGAGTSEPSKNGNLLPLAHYENQSINVYLDTQNRCLIFESISHSLAVLPVNSLDNDLQIQLSQLVVEHSGCGNHDAK